MCRESKKRADKTQISVRRKRSAREAPSAHRKCLASIAREPRATNKGGTQHRAPTELQRRRTGSLLQEPPHRWRAAVSITTTSSAQPCRLLSWTKRRSYLAFADGSPCPQVFTVTEQKLHTVYI